MQFKLIRSLHRMLVTSVSTNIIPLMESFSAYPKWISLAIRIFNTSSGGASEDMFDILVWFLVSPQAYIENYTLYLHKYTFQIREIKQIRISHIRTTCPLSQTDDCALTQTDYNHGCCVTDGGSMLPRMRGVFTAEFNVLVWKHLMRLGGVFRIGTKCAICDQAR